MGKRGTILIENVVFIIINVLFLSILVIFLIKQGSGAIVLEQTYAKEIAMVIDAAKAPMLIKIDMEKGMKIAEENGVPFNEVVKITGNTVAVKLSQGGGYSYSFFNNVEAIPYPDKDVAGMYIFTISQKTGGESNAK